MIEIIDVCSFAQLLFSFSFEKRQFLNHVNSKNVNWYIGKNLTATVIINKHYFIIRTNNK